MSIDPTTVDDVIEAIEARGLLPLIVEVATKWSVSVGDLCGRRRYEQICGARHEAWARLRIQGLSYSDIGRLFAMDHTSVISGIRRHRELLGYRRAPLAKVLVAESAQAARCAS